MSMIRIYTRSVPRWTSLMAMSALLLVGLVACGGGGGDSATAQGPAVSSATVPPTAARYGQPLVVTVDGSNLSGTLSLSSTLCKSPVVLSAAPTMSSATTAYIQCTVSGVGSGQIVISRLSDGSRLAVVPLTVLAPQVTLSLDNGAGVSGTMVITLSADKAPATVANFLSYVNTGFYVGTIVHRVVRGFVVQAGGYIAPSTAGTPTLKATQPPIALEATGLSNLQWSIAMARTSDPNSATSQFYINLVDNSATLDGGPIAGPGYAVFGAVTGGTSAVTAVVDAPCVAIALFLPSGECTPVPYMIVTSATQTQ